LIERELLAQEEIFGGERSLGSQAEGPQAQQVGKGVQPTQAGCQSCTTFFDFDLILHLAVILPSSSQAASFCGAQVAACRQKRRVRFATAAALINELVGSQTSAATRARVGALGPLRSDRAR
jgi:hypothetical protein